MKVRVGHSEFEAEGDEITVNEQYRLFLQVISTQNVDSAASQNGNNVKHGRDGDDPISQDTWDRFYVREGDGDVSLRVLPNTDQPTADALVLLLYGYHQLCNVPTVPSADLLAMGAKSGLRIDRIDRSIPNGHNRYISKGGSRRGSRYALNNQGQAYAQQLLEGEAER
jgi:hypothetical protein